MAAAAPAALLVASCSETTAPAPIEPSRLLLPTNRTTRSPYIGTDVMYGPAKRRAYLRVPASYVHGRPVPLLVAFHGNPARGDWWFNAYGDLIAEAGMVMLAPDSLSTTWDAIGDTFGPDVLFLNEMLEQLWDRCSIDVNRIAVVGFSDGGSYALSLGLANGDLVKQVIAHSPGFIPEAPRIGKPPVYISHGTADLSLHIDHTSRLIVSELRRQGYDTTYREFDGGHVIPLSLAREALSWLWT